MCFRENTMCFQKCFHISHNLRIVPLENISARPPIYVLFSKYEDSFVFQDPGRKSHPTVVFNKDIFDDIIINYQRLSSSGVIIHNCISRLIHFFFFCISTLRRRPFFPFFIVVVSINNIISDYWRRRMSHHPQCIRGTSTIARE